MFAGVYSFGGVQVTLGKIKDMRWLELKLKTNENVREASVDEGGL